MEAEERPSKFRKLDHRDVLKEQDGIKSMASENLGSGSSRSKGVQATNKASDSDGNCSRQGRERGEDYELMDLADASPGLEPAQKPISKNQLKKLKRKEQWEVSRDDRKARRKQKLKEKKERKRNEKDRHGAEQPQESAIPAGELKLKGPINTKRKPSTQLPVTFIIDCGFDTLMMDKEIVSLASQITRCYSTNHQAPFRGHLVVSSYNGELKNRFETTLSGHHRNWKGVRFFEDDVVHTSSKAKELMSGPGGGELAGSFSNTLEGEQDRAQAGEVVYLTSDSPDTLRELKPYSTYIIGGLVDHNRHKGICYKRAMDHGVKTAKLPIGDYMEMNSRFVLAVNHVFEIMIKWLENKDWGESFMEIMPKRKGGSLKGKGGKAEAEAEAVVVEQLEAEPGASKVA